MKLSKDDKFYEIKLSTLNAEKSEALEAANNFDINAKDKRKMNPLPLFRKRARSIQKQ